MSCFDDSDVCRAILESLPTGVCVVDMRKKIIFWSDGAERITGHLRHEVIGHSCIAEPLLHCDQPGCEFCSEECPLARAIKTSQPAEAGGFLHHKAGHEIPVRVRAVPVHNQHGSIIGAAETFEEVQPIANGSRGEPLRLADFTDGVTGVANRAMLQSHLRQAIQVLNEVHIPFTLLFFRIEGLPHFRASLGPEAASSLLRVVARTLESSLSIIDFLGRWSDDAFLVILGNCTEDGIGNVRQRVRRTLAGEGIEWWGERRSLPVSIGEAVAHPDDTVESVVDRAQKALDAASAWRTSASTTGSSSAGS
ncbi:MAG TPA: sensor domain-containing diguanylate cyclase [Candidatus Dormibacteraeota bacterium]|nr:sensor domain-containing diguanylate cyclase [Candidatus Dormibacteraeota bacterium]